MSEETFPYDRWVNEALCSVLSRALKQLAETGPVGDHHFFINFGTTHDGVEIPGFLRAQYPEEITIVLQHQFEDLFIDDQGFEVSLSFNGKKSHLKVPFDAVTSFADPSVNFGLQIGINAITDALPENAEISLVDSNAIPENDPEIGTEKDADTAPTPFAPVQAQKLDENFAEAAPEPGPGETVEDAIDDEPKTAEVIALDAFRKK